MTTSNASEIFGGAAPVGTIAQGQLAANGNYLPCDGADYLKASYPNLDYTGLDTYGTNVSVSRAFSRAGYTKVAYGAGLFVAITSGASSYSTSPDGITWTTRSLGGAPGATFDVIYANGLFVVMGFGSGACLTSPDGITWTTRSIPADVGVWVRVAYAGNLFFAFQASGAGASKIATSSDGITWTLRTAAYTGAYGVAYGAGAYVCIHQTSGASGVLGVSFDGITWFQRSIVNSAGSGITSASWDNVVFLNGKWIISTSTGSVYASTDNLASFGTLALVAAISSPAAIRVIGGLLYILPPAGSAQMFTTLDLQGFKAIPLPYTLGADCVAYGNSTLLVGCLSGSNLATLATDTTKFRTPYLPRINDGDRYYIKAK